MTDNGDRTGMSESDVAMLLAGMEVDGPERAYAIILAQLAREVDNVALLHGAARAAHRAGRCDRAVAHAGQAIRIDPQPRIHITLGLALLALGHAEPARAALHIAVLALPDDPAAHLAYAEALEALGRVEDADHTLLQVVEKRPLEAGYRLVRGRFLERHGHLDDALAAYRSARNLAISDDVITVQHEAELLRRMGRLADAEPVFAAVRDRARGDAAALANHGAVLFELGRMSAATEALEQAVALRPASAETLNNLGLVHMANGDLLAADAAFSGAVALRPDDPQIVLNRGTLLADLGEREQARLVFETLAVHETPAFDARLARFNIAMLDLAEGEYETGWRGFEARRALLAPLPRPDLAEWDGQPGDGTILLSAEQGLGDLIQFLRYVPDALHRVPVCLLVPEAIVGLLHASMRLPIWKNNLATGRLTITHDAGATGGCAEKASVLSLPFLLGAGRPTDFVPYLTAPEGNRWAAEGPLRVGLCWSGNPTYRFDRRRSILPEHLVPLLMTGRSRPGIRWQSLQPGTTPAGVDPLPDGDLASTAAVIASLDLVVTVDTAMAHLAGAMGRPVWLLNRFGGDWRWAEGAWSSASEKSDGKAINLWYPSLRMFQQTVPALPDQAWPPLLDTVARSLGDWTCESQ